MAEKIRRLSNLAGVVPRPRWASVSRGPMWHRFYNSTNPKRAHEFSKPPSLATGTRTLTLVVATVAGLAGYGISKISSGDANAAQNIAAILDTKRIPTIRYASLKDMEKVT